MRGSFSSVQLILLAAGLFQACSSPGEELADSRPNIVLILADDLGIGDIGIYNPESKIPTPYLDQLAAEGMRFTDAHSPSAVCTPTRYGLLTGRYAWRTPLQQGVLWGDSRALIGPEEPTIGKLLQANGYQTALIGKWHLGLGLEAETDYTKPLRPGPMTSGFDTFFGIPATLDMEPYLYIRDDRPIEAATETTDGSYPRRYGGEGFWREGRIAPGFVHEEVLPRITEEAVHYLESIDRNRPFFLLFSLTAPHTPWVPTPEFKGRSRAGDYGDFCVQIDTTIGRILETIDRLGLRDDTLVIFTSDNGSHWMEEDILRFDHRANLYFRGQKGDIWEGGHRVPLIARWPGRIRAGGESPRLLSLTDFYATLAAMLSYELSEREAPDSYNALDALLETESSSPQRTQIVNHSFEGMFSIRDGDWKLILGLGSGGFSEPARIEPHNDGPRAQLYNLATDPGEQTNLYFKHPEKVARLLDLLVSYQDKGRSRP